MYFDCFLPKSNHLGLRKGLWKSCQNKSFTVVGKSFLKKSLDSKVLSDAGNVKSSGFEIARSSSSLNREHNSRVPPPRVSRRLVTITCVQSAVSERCSLSNLIVLASSSPLKSSKVA